MREYGGVVVYIHNRPAVFETEQWVLDSVTITVDMYLDSTALLCTKQGSFGVVETHTIEL